MGTGYTRNDTSNNIADGNIINAADLDGEFDAIESAFGTSGHTHDGTSAEGGPITVLGPVQDFVASATEIKPKTTNTLDIGTNSLLFKDLFLDGVATLGSIKIDNDGTIGSASDGDAIAISSGGVVTFSQNTIGKTGSGYVLSLQTSDTTIEATNVLGKIEFSAPDEASGTDAILVGASIEALAEDTFDSSTNSTALVFKTNTSAAATERMRIKSTGEMSFTGAAEISNTSGDFTLDVAGDIILDADGAQIRFKDAGTEIGVISNSSNDLQIVSSVSDADMIFRGNDGGTPFNALTLDMSDAGTATFNHDIKLPDNGKAIFGAGSDLQIYHDGSNSIIKDAGTGNLKILGTSMNIQSATEENYIEAVANGHVKLFYDAAEKLATTSTGVDITGTLTSDGLTVDTGGSAVEFNHSATGPTLRFNNTDITVADGQQLARIEFSTDDAGVTTDEVYLQLTGDGTGGAAFFDIMTGDGTPTKTARFNVGGDISFYEDTGTTAKFFWDASAESLGIGTDSPSANLHLSGQSQTIKLETTNDSSTFLNIRANSGTGGSFYVGQDSSAGSSFGRGAYAGVVWQSGAYPIVLATNNTERMRIDSSGRVGIGTSDPSSNTSTFYDDLVIKNDTSGTGAGITIQSNTTNGFGAVEFRKADGSQVGKIYASSGGGQLAFETGGSERMRIDSSGNVGIGATSISGVLTLQKNQAASSTAGTGTTLTLNGDANAGNPWEIFRDNGVTGDLVFSQDASGTRSERMRIDSSGNLLVGTTSSSSIAGGSSGSGMMITPNHGEFKRSGGAPLFLNRTTSDGTIAQFRRDGTSVGSIGYTSAGVGYFAGSSTGVGFGSATVYPTDGSGNLNSGTGVKNLGSASYPWKDLYLSGGVYLGGTGSANKLDDYEEGTWTPIISTSSANVTYSGQNGHYTKIGREVFVNWQINLNGLTSVGTGNFGIGGLPFTQTAGKNYGRYVIQTYYVNVDSNAIGIYAYAAGGTQLGVLYSYDNGGWSVATSSSFNISGSTVMSGSFHYISE